VGRIEGDGFFALMVVVLLKTGNMKTKGKRNEAKGKE
jgi:hypothetical protein